MTFVTCPQINDIFDVAVNEAFYLVSPIINSGISGSLHNFHILCPQLEKPDIDRQVLLCWLLLKKRTIVGALLEINLTSVSSNLQIFLSKLNTAKYLLTILIIFVN